MANQKEISFATWRASKKNFLKRNEHLVKKGPSGFSILKTQPTPSEQTKDGRSDPSLSKLTGKVYLTQEKGKSILSSPRFSKSQARKNTLCKITSDILGIRDSGSC